MDEWPTSNYAQTALHTWSASPYFAQAGTVAQNYGIDPSFFQAMIGAESGYDPNASNGNAVGLGQLIVGSAPALTGVDAGNPSANLNASANFFSQLLQECNGDYICASTKYGTLPSSGNLTQNQQLLETIAGNITGQNAVTQCYGSGSTWWQQIGCALGIGSTSQTANAYAQNDVPADVKQTCGAFDVACYLSKYGADTLGIILGLIVLVIGLVMLKNNVDPERAVNIVTSSIGKRARDFAAVAS